MSVRDDLHADAQLQAEVERQTRYLRSQVASQTDEIKELRRFVGFYSSTERATVRPPTWTVRPRKGGHAGLVVAQLTDTHFDEVVRPEEIFELNAYNREIALVRFRTWAEKVVSLPRDYFSGVRIEGLVILATGDVFSGDIHAELRESNEEKLLVSLLFWEEQVLAALELLEREYAGHVSVHAVVGNHGRTTIKPVFKGRAHSNVEWLFWTNVRNRLADRGSKVSVEVSSAMDLNVPIYGRNHLITHGDQFKGGTGISGVLAPLMLGTHRKGQRQAATRMPMDLMVMGHFHQLLDLPGVVVGGSMKGYDEYAFGLNLRPEPARQAMWITTPERGKTLAMPIELQDRAAEGW
ncbi:MAG: hypothetical protein C0498_01255 [Anaerolinea sp.]|nr:hypothetical protein [Anaerolinea sp.]